MLSIRARRLAGLRLIFGLILVSGCSFVQSGNNDVGPFPEGGVVTRTDAPVAPPEENGAGYGDPNTPLPGFSPLAGHAGDLLTLGGPLPGPVDVFIGDAAAVKIDDRTFEIPPHAAGEVSVYLRRADGTPVNLAHPFTYLP